MPDEGVALTRFGGVQSLRLEAGMGPESITAQRMEGRC
jgi:hypothetical protein